jgi:predicted NBD/HSP70 family sugar kinase
LGHTRFFVDTDVCFCGHTGCLEQIFSSGFLRRTSGEPQADLQHHLLHAAPFIPVVQNIAGYVAAGIANAINFIRPDRVVIAGPVLAAEAFCQKLLARIRELLLPPLAERVRIGLWDKKTIDAAEAAAWLSLADVYRGGHVGDWAVSPGPDHSATAASEAGAGEDPEPDDAL